MPRLAPVTITTPFGFAFGIAPFYHEKVLERIKQEWRQFVAEPPGSRFESHYERKRSDEAKGAMGRIAWIAAGIFFVLAGIVMLFTPGPGLLAIGFGVTCFARESRRVARSCDRWELRIRRAWARWRSRGSPRP
jgi:hypothetical protein